VRFEGNVVMNLMLDQPPDAAPAETAEKTRSLSGSGKPAGTK
jgi:hypothetical protein